MKLIPFVRGHIYSINCILTIFNIYGRLICRFRYFIRTKPVGESCFRLLPEEYRCKY